MAIRPQHPNVTCQFHKSKGVRIEFIAEIVDPVFRENYYGGPFDAHYDAFSDNGRDLSDTLRDLTGAQDDRVLEALIDALIDADSYWPPRGEGALHDPDYHYHRDDAALAEHSLLWARFIQILMHDQRFF